MIHGKAHAKINLFLDIVGSRDDGFHNIDTVFMPITLADEFSYEANDIHDIRLSCDRGDCGGMSNTIVKAYRLVKERRACLMGLDVSLKKNIPSGAGLGGGSADAASFLTSVNMMLGLRLTIRNLLDIGSMVGADVPACMVGVPCVGSGTGTGLKTIGRDFLKLYMVIIKPAVSFNTAQMYRRYDELKAAGEIAAPDRGSADIVQALIERDYAGLCTSLYNVFEQVVPERGLIEQLKQKLTDAGAGAALMTGSGSAVYGLFASKEEAETAMERLRCCYECYYAESFGNIE